MISPPNKKHIYATTHRNTTIEDMNSEMKCNYDYCICKWICETSLLKISQWRKENQRRPSKWRANKVQFTSGPANSTWRWQIMRAIWRKLPNITIPISKKTVYNPTIPPLLSQPLQGFPTMFFWRSSRVPRTRCSACLANFSHILPWAEGMWNSTGYKRTIANDIGGAKWRQKMGKQVNTCE